MWREFQEIFEEFDNEILTAIHPSTGESMGVFGGEWNYVAFEVDDFKAAVKELEAAGVDFNPEARESVAEEDLIRSFGVEAF
ncbi:MAG: hypothetical protein OSA93_05760, partial [Akkermansiaceae bacterium]|nr:hypothetical protein [Akkermansiaceae bacterium]